MTAEAPVSISRHKQRKQRLNRVQREIAGEVEWQARNRRSLVLILDTMAQEPFLFIPSHGGTKLATSSARYFAGIEYMSKVTVRSLSKTKRPWEIFLRDDDPGSLVEKIAKELPAFIREKHPQAWGIPINLHGSLQDYREHKSPLIKIVFENGSVVLSTPTQESWNNPRSRS